MADDIFKNDILDDAFEQRQQKRRAERAEQRKKKELERERSRIAAENRKKRSKVILVILAFAVVLAVLVVRNLVQIRELQKEKDLAQTRLEELQIKIQKLSDELDRVSSKEYIEQQARMQLRMIYPGERLYIVLDKNK